VLAKGDAVTLLNQTREIQGEVWVKVRIGAREGWVTRHFWRGPPGVKLFELYEFWVENRIRLEVVTQDMVAAYLRVANAAAQRELLARSGQQ
jgi:hypothetical protein